MSDGSGQSVPAQSVELHLRDIKQLFDFLDPSPFRERYLDAQAEEFIVNWVEELEPDTDLLLTIHLENPPGPGHGEAAVAEAVRYHFTYRAEQAAWRLRDLLREGFKNLGIGLTFLAACLFTARFLRGMDQNTLVSILRESLIIGGWVAMWRPMEIFLYDLWPIRRRRKLYTRLGRMQTRLAVQPVTGNGAAAAGD
jgi:hypothetical protein